MTRTYAYRKWTGLSGLACEVTADVDTTTRPPYPAGIQVYRKTWLAVPAGTHWKDVAWLSFGLSANARDLDDLHPDGLLVDVRRLTFSLAHYRSEVAALAMDGWLHEEFTLPPSRMQVITDPQGTVEFDWGLSEGPFADPFDTGTG